MSIGTVAQGLFKDATHERFPVCTQVTLNHGICDSQCLSCPVGRVNHGDASEAVKREFRPGTRMHMPFEIFSRVADEVASHPHAWLRIHARGEPLLHPRFVELVRYAKRAGVRLVQTFTDAIPLDREMASGILEAGLDVLECSIPRVLFFDGPDCREIIARLQPDVWVKDRQDGERRIVRQEAALVESLGGRVEWISRSRFEVSSSGILAFLEVAPSRHAPAR